MALSRRFTAKFFFYAMIATKSQKFQSFLVNLRPSAECRKKCANQFSSSFSIDEFFFQFCNGAQVSIFFPFFLPLPLPLSYLPYVAIFLSLTFSFLSVSLHFPLPALSFPTPHSLISHFPLPAPTFPIDAEQAVELPIRLFLLHHPSSESTIRRPINRHQVLK